MAGSSEAKFSRSPSCVSREARGSQIVGGALELARSKVSRRRAGFPHHRASLLKNLLRTITLIAMSLKHPRNRT